MVKKYERANFSSKDSGNLTWANVSIRVFGAPKYLNKKNQLLFEQYIISSFKTFPCSICRGHTKNIFDKCPLRKSDLISRETLIDWLYKFHNEVNKSLGKESISFKNYYTFWSSKIVGYSME